MRLILKISLLSFIVLSQISVYGQKIHLGGIIEYGKHSFKTVDEYSYITNWTIDQNSMPRISLGLIKSIGWDYGVNLTFVNKLGFARYNFNGSYNDEDYWDHGYNRIKYNYTFNFDKKYLIYNGELNLSIPLSPPKNHFPLYILTGISTQSEIYSKTLKDVGNVNLQYSSYDPQSMTTYIAPMQSDDYSISEKFEYDFKHLRHINIGIEIRTINKQKWKISATLYAKIPAFYKKEKLLYGTRIYDNFLSPKNYFSFNISIQYQLFNITKPTTVYEEPYDKMNKKVANN